jgi:outer membrane receptor protein involved in Fe transport
VAIGVRHTIGARLATYLRTAAVARHDAAGPSEVITPGFVMVDAGVSWHWTPRVDVRGVLRNLLDQRAYSNAGPRWVYAPGRSGSVTFAVVF